MGTALTEDKQNFCDVTLKLLFFAMMVEKQGEKLTNESRAIIG